IATQIENLEVGPEPFELLGTADAAGADTGSAGQCAEASGFQRDEHIADRRTFQNRGKLKSRIENRRHIFKTVDGEVHIAAIERVLEFLDEDSLIDDSFDLSDLAQRNIRAAIAGRLDDPAFHAQLRDRGE